MSPDKSKPDSKKRIFALDDERAVKKWRREYERRLEAGEREKQRTENRERIQAIKRARRQLREEGFEDPKHYDRKDGSYCAHGSVEAHNARYEEVLKGHG